MITDQDASIVVDGQTLSLDLIMGVTKRVTSYPLEDKSSIYKGGFSAVRAWNFNGTLNDWSSHGDPAYGGFTAGPTALTLTALSTTYPVLILAIYRFFSTAEKYLGISAPTVRYRVKKPTNGAPWSGALYWAVDGVHPLSYSYYVAVPEPAWGADDWGIAGYTFQPGTPMGDDYLGGLISGLQITPVAENTTSPPSTQTQIDCIAAGVITGKKTNPITTIEVSPLVRAVMMSLLTWRRADADDVLPGGALDSRMGWWGDGFASVASDSIGSRLWLLSREKLLPQTVEKAKRYAQEALAWLVEDGVAARVEVDAERQGISTLALGVRIFKADGKQTDIRFPDVWRFLQ